VSVGSRPKLKWITAVESQLKTCRNKKRLTGVVIHLNALKMTKKLNEALILADEN